MTMRRIVFAAVLGIVAGASAMNAVLVDRRPQIASPRDSNVVVFDNTELERGDLEPFLDDDPGVRPSAHIFVGSKAPWYEVHDELPRFEEWPPGYEPPKD